MKKILCALIIVLTFSGAAFSASSSSSELKRMSTFVSNFTEVGLMYFDIEDLSDTELARFGIWHNWINNFKTRIKRCPKKNCPYGSSIIDKTYVAESVKKYFDLEINHSNVEDENDLHYDGRVYHFDGADGECTLARVLEYEKRGNVVIMRGETYYPDHEDLKGSPFTAKAKPYKFNGKNTWAILSLEVGD